MGAENIFVSVKGSTGKMGFTCDNVKQKYFDQIFC